MTNETLQTINLLTQIITPAGLVAWGVWFVTVKVWPWFTGKHSDNAHEHHMKELSANEAIGLGLKAQAEAIVVLVACMNRGLENAQSRAPDPVR